MMQYNISPETIVGMSETHPGVDNMLSKSYDTSSIKDVNQTITPNGALFSRDKHGFLPELMHKMYSDRSATKKQMLQVSQQYESTGDVKYKNMIPKLHNKQMALKIALNSFMVQSGINTFDSMTFALQRQLPMVVSCRFVGLNRHSMNTSMSC